MNAEVRVEHGPSDFADLNSPLCRAARFVKTRKPSRKVCTTLRTVPFSLELIFAIVLSVLVASKVLCATLYTLSAQTPEDPGKPFEWTPEALQVYTDAVTTLTG